MARFGHHYGGHFVSYDVSDVMRNSKCFLSFFVLFVIRDNDG